MSAPTRALLSVSLLLATVGVGCAVEEVLPAPSCEDGGSSLIVAQSVPSASQVPCLTRLPDGWEVASVRVDEDGTRVELDSDRAGDAAAVLWMEQACDVSAAVKAPSDLPPAERFDEIERLTPSFVGARYYVFEGGCVWWTFDFDEGASATQTVAIGEALMLVSRDSINEGLRETFIDEEL